MNSIGRKMIAGALCLLILLGCCSCASAQEKEYRAALALLEEGKYEEAYGALYLLGEYKDAQSYFEKIVALPTEKKGQNQEIVFIGDKATAISGKFTNKITYNDFGQVTMDSVKYQNDSTKATEYVYDEHNNQIAEIEYVDGKMISKKTIECKYDSEDRLISCYTVDTKLRETWEYHANGQKKSEKAEHEKGSTSKYAKYRHYYTYDENGNLLTAENTDYDGNKRSTEYTYDDKGNMIGQKSKDDMYERTYRYEYDENNHKIKEAWTIKTIATGTENSYEYIWKYDDQGNLLERRDESGGILEAYEYDEQGNVTRCIVSGKEYVYKRNYDADGNLSEEIKYLLKDGFEVKEESTDYLYYENGKIQKMTKKSEVSNSDDASYFELYYENGLLKQHDLEEYVSYRYFYFPDGVPEYLAEEKA